MTKTKKNKSIIKRILAFLGAGVCAIACMLCCFGSVENRQNVYADEITYDGYKFVGSPLICSFSFWDGSQFVQNSAGYYKFEQYGIALCLFGVKFESDGSNLIRQLSVGTHSLAYWSDGSDNIDNGGLLYHNYNIYGKSHTETPSVFSYHVSVFAGTPYKYYVDVLSNNVVYLDNLYYIKMGRPVKFDICTIEAATFLTYYDKDNNYIKFKLFALISYLPEDYHFDDLPLRTYYFDEYFNLSDNQYYTDGYESGLSAGYTNGYNTGKNEGYNEGLSLGKNIGYNNGYNKGVSENNDYTFLGLISACIDAPITYFTSLFNFELLGVNLSAFLTGLFTLCVIITIVRLVLGGK